MDIASKRCGCNSPTTAGAMISPTGRRTAGTLFSIQPCRRPVRYGPCSRWPNSVAGNGVYVSSTSSSSICFLLRSYFPMEEEKGHRVFGAMDGAIRGTCSARWSSARWSRQKLFLVQPPDPRDIRCPRHAAGDRSCRTPSPQRAGRADDRRGPGLDVQMNLKQPYINHYIDPAGFDISEKVFANITRARSAGSSARASSLATRSPRRTSTRPRRRDRLDQRLFVAMPGRPRRERDYLLPPVFHSVESDESRHIYDGARSSWRLPTSQTVGRSSATCGTLVDNHCVSTRRSAPSSSTARRTVAGPRSYAEMRAADLRRLLPQLPDPAGEVRPDDPARPGRGAWNRI